jgi:hypothetical protein
LQFVWEGRAGRGWGLSISNVVFAGASAANWLLSVFVCFSSIFVDYFSLFRSVPFSLTRSLSLSLAFIHSLTYTHTHTPRTHTPHTHIHTHTRTLFPASQADLDIFFLCMCAQSCLLNTIGFLRVISVVVLTKLIILVILISLMCIKKLM